MLLGRVLEVLGPESIEVLDDAMVMIEPLWREACEALAHCGHRVKVAVDNATYHRMWPVALIVRPGLAEFDLIDGLQALVRWRNWIRSVS